MKKSLQYVFLFLFFIFVVFLGFLAYKMTSNVLVFAFYGQEKQQGKELVLSVSRPGVISKIIPSGTLLDQEAIQKSLLLNGEKVSADFFDIYFSESFVKIVPKWAVNGDMVVLSSGLYNEQKRTSFQLPSDVSLLVDPQFVSDLEVIPVEMEPKKAQFEIRSENIPSDNILLYVYYPSSWESCFDDNFIWNYKNFSPLHILEKNINLDGVISVDLNTKKERQCVLAWYGNQIFPVLDRALEEFSLLGSITTDISDENNFKNSVYISSTAPLIWQDFSDDETYVSAVKNLKKHIISKVSFSPEVAFWENDIAIVEWGFEVRARFEDEKKYTIFIQDLEDIYGRTASMKMDFIPKNNTYMGIDLVGEKYDFASLGDVKVNVFSSDIHKRNYEIKACRLNVAGFSRIADIIQEGDKEKIPEVYSILTSSSATDCQKASVHFEENEVLSTLSLFDVFDKNIFRPGLYVLAFRDFEDIKSVEQWVFPVLFSFSNIEILSELQENGMTTMRLLDSFSGSVLSNQEIEIFEKISENNEPVSYATGSIIWKTDENGVLQVDFSWFAEKEVFVVARSSGKFWYFSYKFPKVSNNYNAYLEINGNNFTKGDTLYFFANIQKALWNQEKEIFHIFLSDLEGKVLKKWDMKPNEKGIISSEYTFSENDSFGEYVVYVTLENGKKLASKNLFLRSDVYTYNSIDLSISVPSSNENIPKNLRERANISGEKAYYPYEYFAPIELDIRASVLNSWGEKFKNTPFEYMVSRKKGNSGMEKIYEWKWKFDAEGLGRVILSIEFSSYFHDVEYVVSVKTQDITTGEILTAEQKITLSLPEELKTFDDTLVPKFALKKEFFATGEMLVWEFSADISEHIVWKYYYEILDAENNSLKKELVQDKNFNIATNDFLSGRYTIRVFPVTPEGIKPAEKNIFSKDFFLMGEWKYSSENLLVFLNATDKNNEFNVLVLAPENTTHLLVLGENNAIKTEYLPFSGGVLEKNITFLSENTTQKLQLLARTPSGFLFTEKEIFIDENSVFPEVDFVHEEIKNIQDNQKVKIVFKNLESEKIGNISVKLVEGEYNHEYTQNNFLQKKSLQNAFFGNIFQKNFIEKKTVKKEKNKDIYEKNLYFNPSVPLSEKNEFVFSLPLLNWNKSYTLVVDYISATGEQKIFTKIIAPKRDFAIWAHLPESVFPGDKVEIVISANNFTNTISSVDWGIEFFHENTPMSFSGAMNLNINQTEKQSENIRISDDWRGEIPFSLFLKKWKDIVATQTGSIFVDEIPSMGLGKNTTGWTNSESEIIFTENPLIDGAKSLVEIRVATDFSVVIPGILEDLKNVKKVSQTEFLQEIFLKNSLQKSEKLSFLNSDNISEELEKFLEKENFQSWKEIMTERQILDNMRLLLELKKSGVTVPNAWNMELQKYFSEEFLQKISEKPDDIKTQILLIQTIVSWDTDESILSQIDKNNLSEEWFLNYLENYILAKRVLSSELYDEFWIRFEQKLNLVSPLAKEKAYLARYARIGFLTGKAEKANEILRAYFIKSSSGISSLWEKNELVLLAIAHSNVVLTSDAKVKFSAEKIAAEGVISKNTKIISWPLIREKIALWGKIITENKTPIFYEIREKNYLEVPSLFSEKESEFLKISQKIEKVDEKSGVDETGKFRKFENISGNFLEKNGLYRVKISVHIQNTVGSQWSDIIMRTYTFPWSEIFIPERNLQAFLWDSFPLDFAKISRKDNYLMLEKKAWEWDKDMYFEYYFRPKFSGSYLLPASFVYFVDGKEFFANSSHEYYHIK